MEPRYYLGNEKVAAAGGELFHLRPGVYNSIMEDTTYLPERWGTTVILDSGASYGSAIFLSTTGKLYHREYTLQDHSWYSGWIATDSKVIIISNLTTPSEATGNITGGKLPSGYTILQLQINAYGQWRGNICPVAEGPDGSMYAVTLSTDYQNKPCRIIAVKLII